MAFVNKITGREYNTLRGLLNSLRPLNITSEEYYLKYVYETGQNVCETCGKETDYSKWGFKRFCSKTCSDNSPIHKQSQKDKFEKKWVQDSYRNAHKKINFSTSIEKRRQSELKKAESLGISLKEYYSNKSIMAATSISATKRKNMVIKRMRTLGSNTDKTYRSAYRDFSFRGDTIRVQGYEDRVLSYLENSLFNDYNIIAGGKPIVVEYFSTEDNKKHMYFPDIYVEEPNILIEVKSSYTYKMHKQQVLDKIAGCIVSGYKIITLVFGSNKIRDYGISNETKNLLNWAISSQASYNSLIVFDEGSTTIRKGVVSSDTKCRTSLVEGDIVWSDMKVSAAGNAAE